MRVDTKINKDSCIKVEFGKCIFKPIKGMSSIDWISCKINKVQEILISQKVTYLFVIADLELERFQNAKFR